jgi:hypothetical protein
MNLMPITLDSATNAKKGMLLSTPGLKPLLSTATAPCRGLFSEDGRTWAVLGPTLYELTLDTPTATSRGTIPDDGQPVSFASNGRGGEQLAMVGNGALYTLDLDTNTFAGPIVTPNTNAAVCTGFLDGYFFLLEADTVKVWFSALEDGSSWDALDYFARSQTSDNYVGLAIVKDRIWAFGSATTDILYNSGDADTPFVPYPGAVLFEGLVGPWAWTTDGKALYWCAQNAQGRARFVAAVEGQVQAISTDAIDFALTQATDLTDVEALGYWQEGHFFAIWTVPTAGNCGRTFAFDSKEQLWHERGSYDALLGVFYRWRVRRICSTAQGLICGDYATSDLYQLDLDTFTENGAMIRRVRRAPYLSGDAQIAFVDQVELGAQVGIGLSSGQGLAPTVLARVSRDGAMTWTPTVSATLGAMGQYGTRAVWRRLGRVRLDRFVLEVSITDPVRVAFGPGLQLRLTQGNGQL